MLDKLPNAHIEESFENGVIVSVESFGDGLKKWFKSQGDKVKI